MAWEVQSLIWKMSTTKKLTSEMKFTALAYANFSKPDGTDVYPSVLTVAGITGYHERSTQRYQRELVRLGVLVPDGKGPKGTNKYRFPVVTIAGELALDLEWVTHSHPRQSGRGDNASKRGDFPSGDNLSGGTQSPKPNKSKKEPKSSSSSEASTSSFKIACKTFAEEIGTVTPFIKEQLSNAIENYSQAWVVYAIKEASLHNRRHWKYIKGILQRMQDEVKQGGYQAMVRSASDKR